MNFQDLILHVCVCGGGGVCVCARGGRQGPGKSQCKSAARELEVRLKTIIPAYMRGGAAGGRLWASPLSKAGLQTWEGQEDLRRAWSGDHESGGQQG